MIIYIYVIGTFTGTIDLDPSSDTTDITSNGSTDFFVAKYNKYGVLIWGESFGAKNVDEAADIYVDNSGSVYVTGFFANTVDFDPDLGVENLSSDSRSAFILKLKNNGNYIWAGKMGAVPNWVSGTAEGKSIAIDESGNIIIAGIFAGEVDFDPSDGTNTFKSNGYSNGFVAQYTSSGDLDWVRCVRSSSYTSATAVAINSFGDIIVAGSCKDSTNFDTQNGLFASGYSSSTFDAYVWKLNTSGTTGWVTPFKETGDGSISSLAIDNSANIYTIGSFFGDFTPNQLPPISSANNSTDILIAKLNYKGEISWAKNIGGLGTDVGFDIAVNSESEIHAIGYFMNSADFDPSQNESILSSSFKSVFVLKMNSLGDYIYAYQIDNNTNTTLKTGGIAVDNSGNVVVTQDLTDETDLDPTICIFNQTPITGTSSFFLQKVNLTVLSSCQSNTTITSQPLSTNACSGKIATFAVTAMGSNLVYQWQKFNSATGAYDDLATTNDYSGVNLSVLTISTKSGNVGGMYRCKVGLDLFSDIVTLTVSSAPLPSKILTQNKEACSNTFILKVQDYGNYKWTLANAISPDTLKIYNEIRNDQGISVTETTVGNFKTGISKLYLTTKNTAGCTRLDSTTLSYFPNETASLSSGTIQGDSVLLIAEPIVRNNIPFSGTWSVLNGNATIKDPQRASTYAKFSDFNDYDFVYTISNPCSTNAMLSVSYSNTNVNIVVDGGSSKNSCSDTATLQAIALPQGYAGAWRSANPKVVFSDSTKANTKVSGLVIGDNDVIWVAKSNNKVIGTDTVTITSKALPSTVIPLYVRSCLKTTSIGIPLKSGENVSFTSLGRAGIVSSDIGINQFTITNLQRYPTQNVFNWTVSNRYCSKSGQLNYFLSDTILMEKQNISGNAGDTIKVKVSAVTAKNLFSKIDVYDSLIVEEIAGTKSNVVLNKYTVGDTVVYFVTNRKLISKETYLYRLRNSCGYVSDTAGLIINTKNVPPVKTRSIPLAEGLKTYRIRINLFELDSNRYLDTIRLINAPAGVVTKISYPDSFSVIFEIDLTNAPTSSESQTVLFRYADTQGRGELTFVIPATSSDLVFYNALSPNDDGKNDVFEIDGITQEKYKDNKVEIFNRWGDRVYKASGYNNKEVAFDGNSLPEGTYYYVVQVGEIRKLFKGFLVLKR